MREKSQSGEKGKMNGEDYKGQLESNERGKERERGEDHKGQSEGNAATPLHCAEQGLSEAEFRGERMCAAPL
jgi:hypothetical protein